MAVAANGVCSRICLAPPRLELNRKAHDLVAVGATTPMKAMLAPPSTTAIGGHRRHRRLCRHPTKCRTAAGRDRDRGPPSTARRTFSSSRSSGSRRSGGSRSMSRCVSTHHVCRRLHTTPCASDSGGPPSPLPPLLTGPRRSNLDPPAPLPPPHARALSALPHPEQVRLHRHTTLTSTKKNKIQKKKKKKKKIQTKRRKEKGEPPRPNKHSLHP